MERNEFKRNLVAAIRGGKRDEIKRVLESRPKVQKGIVVIYDKQGLYYEDTHPEVKLTEDEMGSHIEKLSAGVDLTVVYLPEPGPPRNKNLELGGIAYEKLSDETLREVVEISKKLERKLDSDGKFDGVENKLQGTENVSWDDLSDSAKWDIVMSMQKENI
jgi:hypothetical protein